MKHYVYRITNIKLNKHYYGTRTSKNKTPEEDIGIYYFSSSKDKEFIKDQKENPQNYKYKIIKKFNTRKEALELEIKLHNKFNVGVNESFYNKSKQTSTGWDTTGSKIIFSDEHKNNLSKAGKGRKFNKNWKRKISEAKANMKPEDNPMFGKKHSLASRKKMSESQSGNKASEETKKKMSENNKGKANPMFGKKQPTMTCPYCKNTYSKTNIKRFHLDKCKMKL